MEYVEFKEIVENVFPELAQSGRTGLFARMPGIYEQWNSKINVISRKDITELYPHHILHSLCIAYYLKEKSPENFDFFEEGASVLDLGTGGGFPGIPLAVLFPKSKFTLCDSVGKKIKVASAVAGELGLDNVSCVNARAESLTGKFDFVVSRAVASLDVFYPWVKGKYLKKVLCLKGGDVNEEISRLWIRCRFRGAVDAWPVDEWLKDDYFKGKFVIAF